VRLKYNKVKRLQRMGRARRIYSKEDLVLTTVLEKLDRKVRSMAIKDEELSRCRNSANAGRIEGLN
jgi:hypothetical protein